MKKILFSIALIASGLVASAQVGVGTTDPQVSLQVDRSNVATDADGVLVPRVTVAQLNDKAAAYVAAQNGALVFITDITGFAGKTSNVTATGFHYYNSTTEKWVAVGGAPQRYEGTRGTVTILQDQTVYTATANDFYIITKAGGAMSIFLGSPVLNVGRLVYVTNNNTASGFVTVFSGTPGPGNNTSTLLNGLLAQNRGKAYISDGVTWSAISFN